MKSDFTQELEKKILDSGDDSVICFQEFCKNMLIKIWATVIPSWRYITEVVKRFSTQFSGLELGYLSLKSHAKC